MTSWRPSASVEVLRMRAAVLAALRRFFADRGVLEVETPALSGAGHAERNIFNVTCQLREAGDTPVYLHTSPEFAMKRLLAAGAPDIFQVCRVFRDAERGRRHEPEFTLLEWYRRDFDLDQMIAEACELVETLAVCAGRPAAGRETLTYRQAFLRAGGVDPFAATAAELAGHADRLLGAEITPLRPALGDDRDAWLDLLAERVVMPSLEPGSLVAITHFPATQAGLARLSPDDPRMAERFELYFGGLELGNGYRELLDPVEQRARFTAEQERRRRAGQPATRIDEALLAALEAGLPDCSGVAIGLDRILMACLGAGDIGQVISFRSYFTRDTYS